VGRQHAWNCAITPVLPRIADLSASDGLFIDSLISSIAQADEAAKERVRAFSKGVPTRCRNNENPQARDAPSPPPAGIKQSGRATFAHARPQADDIRRPPPEGV